MSGSELIATDKRVRALIKYTILIFSVVSFLYVPLFGVRSRDIHWVLRHLIRRKRFISVLKSLFRSEYNQGLIPDEENATSSTQSQTTRIFLQ